MPTVTYFCRCAYDGVRTAHTPARVPAHLPAVLPESMPLASMYFCEDCYELRCNACIAWEVSTCYCPHCLFEVPSTRIQAQHGTCARSCFVCPVCTHVLSIQASDPPRALALSQPASSQGVPPYYLACTACRWDSKHAGIVAESAAGLASAVDAHPAQASMDSLADALDQWLHPPSKRRTPPSAWLTERAVPPQYWQGPHRRAPSPPDEFTPLPWATTRAQHKQAAREARRASWAAAQTHAGGEVRTLTHAAQRDAAPLEQPYESTALRPERVRLLAKLCKRCPDCRRILVRPELRTSSSAYKVRQLAEHILPALSLAREKTEDGVYTAELTLCNVLGEPIDVEVAVDGAYLPTTAWHLGTDEDRAASTLVEWTHPLAQLAVYVRWSVAEGPAHAFWARMPVLSSP